MYQAGALAVAKIRLHGRILIRETAFDGINSRHAGITNNLADHIFNYYCFGRYTLKLAFLVFRLPVHAYTVFNTVL